MLRRLSLDQIAVKALAYIVVSGFALAALLPFFALAVSSFTSEHDIINHGFSLWPREFSLESYRLIFRNPLGILHAYLVSILVTVLGTAVSLWLSSMAAFVMYRKDVKYRNVLAFFLYFTTLFSGGLAPYFIVVTNYLHLKNTIFVLLLVPMFNVLYILILRNFLRTSIPDELIEAAKIDGAGDFGIYARVVIPLFKPALASIGLLIGLNYWNDWWTPMMFVEKQGLWPLQYVLYRILSSVNFTAAMVNNAGYFNLPKESLKLAMTVVAVGPIVLVLPFVQKYFVRGITLGAIKG